MKGRARRNVLIPTDYGTFCVSRFDQGPGFLGVGGQLLTNGTFDDQEVELLRQIAVRLPANPVILDIGANIGVHSVNLAESVSHLNGTILSFEPQRIVFQMLCANLAINSIDNVYAFNKAVGSENILIKIPTIDYYQNASIGSLELTPIQKENIGQRPMLNETSEKVECISLDSLNLPRLDLIKIDVEGMEDHVLEGATTLFSTLKPICFIEWMKSDKEKLRYWFTSKGFTVHEVGYNFLCIHNDSDFKNLISHQN